MPKKPSGSCSGRISPSQRAACELLRAGELEGERDERGRWHVYRREVHRLLEERRDPGFAGEAAEEARESPRVRGRG